MGKDLKGKELGKGISQGKDKRYYARFTNRYGQRSKPYYSFSLKEVRDWLAKQKYEDKLGKPEIFHENVTVREAYELWYKEKKKNVRPQTLEHIRGKYRTHIKKYEFKKLVDIDKKFVETFMASLIIKELCLRYIQAIQSVFSQIMEFSIEKEWCSVNPFLRYHIPKTVRDKDSRHQQELKMNKFLTLEQQKIFLDYIESAKRCHYKDLFKFLLYTGLRISEAIALRWVNVNLNDGNIFVIDNCVRYRDEDNITHISYNAPTKSQSSTAIIPLTQEAINVLNEVRKKTQKKGKNDFVFQSYKNLAVTRKGVESVLTNLIKTINKSLDADNQLPNITPHFFRHTFAENFMLKGANLVGVQYLMRHSNLTTTANSYGHTAYSVAKDVINRCEENAT